MCTYLFTIIVWLYIFVIIVWLYIIVIIVWLYIFVIIVWLYIIVIIVWLYIFVIIVWLYILLCYRCGELPANVLIHFQITSNNQYEDIYFTHSLPNLITDRVKMIRDERA